VLMSIERTITNTVLVYTLESFLTARFKCCIIIIKMEGLSFILLMKDTV
jgi:hypothetical protein